MEENKYLKNWTWKNINRREGKEMGHIEKVDWLRSEIQKVIDEINSPEILHNIDNGLTWNNIYTHLQESRMWLGFEFGRIRDES